jgi:hypothetical protein
MVALVSTSWRTSLETLAKVHDIANAVVVARADGGDAGDQDRESDECRAHVFFALRWGCKSDFESFL